jgi:hypothetical protein
MKNKEIVKRKYLYNSHYFMADDMMMHKAYYVWKTF